MEDALQERLEILRGRAAIEQDIDKFLAILHEINNLLEEKQSPSSGASPAGLRRPDSESPK